MDNSFQTSFIPKKPITGSGSTGSPVSIFMVVSVFILVVMLSASGGLYFYKDYLQKNKLALSENLKKVKESFDNNTIVELETYDKTASVAKEVLANHTVLSPLFDLINELTLSSIQYTRFDYSTDKGAFSVKMSGISRDYRSIALQADVFNTKKGSMFKNVIFSNLTKDKNNFVTFSLEFDVDKSLLSYSNNIVNTNADSNIVNTENTSSINPDSSTGQNTLEATNNKQ